jgi:hypothetical protein
MSRGKAGKRNRKKVIYRLQELNSLDPKYYGTLCDKVVEYNTSRAQAKFKTPLWISIENEDLLPDNFKEVEFLSENGWLTVIGSIDGYYEIWDDAGNCITDVVTHWRHVQEVEGE